MLSAEALIQDGAYPILIQDGAYYPTIARTKENEFAT